MVTNKSLIRTEAVFSNDGKHRFLLHKEWDKTKQTAMLIMKNPSIADTVSLDATTINVINNLVKLNFGSVDIVNLYSLISSKLRFSSDMGINHSENDHFIRKYAEKADIIIIAWGKIGNSKVVQLRQNELLQLISPYQDKIHIICDKKGNKGLHPLCPLIKHEWILEKIGKGESSD